MSVVEEPAKTTADLYKSLREMGEVTLRWDESGIIAGARLLAKADGLIVVQSRSGNFRSMDRYDARVRNYVVSLTTDGVHITNPDVRI